MSKRVCTSFIIATLSFSVMTKDLFAQAPEVLWAKTFGGSDNDFGNCVRQTSDGGFIIAGTTASSGAGDRDAWLIRTDSSGNALWSKTIGGTEMEEAYSVWQNRDGGFILTGQIRSAPADSVDILLVRTNGSGNLMWVKTYGGPGFQYGTSVQQNSDGGFIVAGSNILDSAFHSEAILLLTDSSGNEIQIKGFRRGNYDYARSVVQSAAGGYTFCGRTAESDIIYNAWFISTDPSLNLLNDKVYGDSLSEYGESLKQTQDGGYIIGGTTYSYGAGGADLWLVRTNSSGDTLWTKTYGGTGTEIGYSVDLTNDGGFIFTGYTSSFGNGNRDIWLIRTNNSGDTVWTKTVGGTSGDQGNSVQHLADGGFIVSGYTDSYGSGRSDVWLVRLDSLLTIPVELSSFIASVIQNSINLAWITATETNNRGFEIERASLASALDGSSTMPGQGNPQSAIRNPKWVKLGFLEGHGTTTETQTYSFIDKNVSEGSYKYRLKQIDFDGTDEYSNELEVNISSPSDFYLGQNYPNPFNPNTTIRYSIPQGSNVTLKVYDVLGKEVAALVDEYKTAGDYEIVFNANHLPSGVYFYRLQSGNFSDTNKLVLLH